jgi:O-antigen ligase
MTVGSPAAHWRLSQPFAANERLIRSALFLGIFLHVWLTASPFPDLSDPSAFEPSTNGNLQGQIIEILLTSALGAFAIGGTLTLFKRVVTPILVIIFLWFACSVALSLYPALGARRLLLASFGIFQAAIFVFLPEDRIHFARLLAVCALVVLALCWGGVIFAPNLSIHQPADFGEADLIGNWRGFFAHKNGAGAGMALLVIFGIYIFRRLNAVLGAAIVALSALFLFFTVAKSPTTLLPLALVFSVIFVRVKNPIAKLIVLISVPAIIGALTIGSVQFPALNALVSKLISDPTFTGRDEIWRFTLDYVARRPVVGFGYQAFWQTDDLVSKWTYLEWGYRASEAHNGYLDIAVTTGVVGLVLVLGWVVMRPFLDCVRTPLESVDPALNLLFIQCWLFGLYLSGFESDLFNNGNSVWFMTAVSIIALRVQATAPTQRMPDD